MIYGKMWTVVSPKVGIPVFLAAVAVASFSVHLALVTNTPWIKAYFNGAAGRAAATQPVAMASQAAPPETAK
ncbi:MAG: light-harvesting protein [Burkholderiaceae bacterium]|nr:light-harvesting protein [Burkholderiaceae bacterium]